MTTGTSEAGSVRRGEDKERRIAARGRLTVRMVFALVYKMQKRNCLKHFWCINRVLTLISHQIDTDVMKKFMNSREAVSPAP